MTLGEHLGELRHRLIYAIIALVVSTAGSLYFCPAIIALLKAPYAEAMARLGMDDKLVVLGVASGLTTYMRVSFYAGLIISAPLILQQLWMFVAAGLYEREKRYVMFAVPVSVGLFLAGAAFFLLVLSQSILYYLMTVSRWLGMVPMITFDRYFMGRMMVLFGLAFQTPLLVLVLAAVGLVSRGTLNRYRKHVIVVAVVLAAVVTPPDPLSQIALALPLWMLYELGVVLVYIFVKR